jgi:ATP-dependent exoDNAse (exonuclease V) beta subunit
VTKHLPLAKYAAWSPSKATLAGTCPLAFKYRYVDSISTGSKNTAAKVGVAVHRALELHLGGADINIAMETAIAEDDAELTHGEKEQVRTFTSRVIEFAQRIQKFTAGNKVTRILLEAEWAITANYTACSFGHPDGIVRGVVDMALVMENGYVIILDHKTGRLRAPSYYQTQLDFYTVMALSHFPDLKGVQCALHYVAHGKIEWNDPVKVAHIRNVLQPWIISFLNKKAEYADTAVATPGKHCNWCDYRSICQFRGMNVKDGEGDKNREA